MREKLREKNIKAPKGECQDESKETKELIEEYRDYLNNLKSIKNELGKRLGSSEVKFIDEQVNLGESVGSVMSSIERRTGLEEARLKIFNNFENQGIFEKLNDGKIVADIDKLLKFFKSTLIDKLGPIYSGKYLGNRNTAKTLSLLFNDKDLKVISREDYEQGSEQAKDLFYFPESKEDALDIKKIKASDFYLSLRDVAQVKYNHPDTRYGNINDLDYREVLLPLLIYHPKYGDGYRNKKTGKLKVRDLKTNEYVKLGVDWIRKNYGNFGQIKGGEGMHDPHNFVRRKLPNLFQGGHNLLKPEDFTVRVDERREPTERRISNIKKKGVVSLNGVDHILGAKYAEDSYQAIELSSDLGAIVDIDKEQARPVALFNIFEKDNKFSRTTNRKRKYYQARLSETKPRPYSLEEFFSKHENEEGEEYQERLRSMPNMDKLISISNDLRTEAGVSLVRYDYADQLLLTQATEKYGRKRVIKFIQDYKDEGARMLISALKQGREKDVLNIAEEFDPQFAGQVFARYNEILNLKDISREDIRKMFKSSPDITKTDINNYSQNIEIRASQLLEKFSNNKEKISREELLNDLEDYKSDSVNYAAICKMAREAGELDFAEMRDTRFMGLTSEQLSDNQKEMIRQIVEVNYPRPDQQEEVVEKIEEAFNNSNKTEWKLLVRRQEDGSEALVSCIRFDQIDDDNVYAASLNVGPEYQDSRLGDAMFHKTMNDAAKYKKIHAISQVDKPVSQFYVNKGGFNISGVKTNKKTGINYYKIERLDEDNEMLSTKNKNLSDKDLIRNHKKGVDIDNLIKSQQYNFTVLFDEQKQAHLKRIIRATDAGYMVTKVLPSEKANEQYYVFDKRPVQMSEAA